MITAALVKELREKTGAGMMDCKKALQETNADLEAAVDWLRQKGLASAAKKASRVAAEGLVGAYTEDGVGVALEVNSETDFVAKNDSFTQFVLDATKLVIQSGSDIEALKNLTLDGMRVEDKLSDLIATIGENMSIRRAVKLEADAVASYMHNSEIENLGKIGVLVALNGDKEKAQSIGKQVAMHIAAMNPLALNEEQIDSDTIERERNVQISQARESGRPEEIIQKMIEGRMRKFIQESALVNQPLAMNPDVTVGEFVKSEGLEIVDFVRFALGEGIEKKEENFAEEVSKVLS